MAEFLIELIGEVAGGVLELLFDGAVGRMKASGRARREAGQEKKRRKNLCP